MGRKRYAMTVAVGILLLAGCGEDAEPTSEANQLMPQKVRYEVVTSDGVTIPAGGPVRADVTVATPDGTEQSTVNLPMTSKGGEPGYELAFMPGQFVYVSAQKGDYRGGITCRIIVADVDGANERIISENTSTGDHAIATCQGTV